MHFIGLGFFSPDNHRRIFIIQNTPDLEETHYQAIIFSNLN